MHATPSSPPLFQIQVPTPQPWLTLISDFCVCCSTPVNTELKRKPSKQSSNLGSLAHRSPWWLTQMWPPASPLTSGGEDRSDPPEETEVK